MTSLYSKQFYSTRRALTDVSAQIIIERLFEYFKPDSVIDFGCGTGIWLRNCLERGVETVMGIDGDWVNVSDLEIAPGKFSVHDLGKTAYQPENRFDLAICIEVAEHLDESMGNTLVESLVLASDIVLFSSAIVGQGGTGHINEQRQGYWAEKFMDRGYLCLDLIRPAIWGNESVNVIYKQNMLVYVSREKFASTFNSNQTLSASFDLDRVHPELFVLKTSAAKNTSIIRKLGRLVKNSVGPDMRR